jgi:Ca2+-binding RTX toxin-like protein
MIFVVALCQRALDFEHIVTVHLFKGEDLMANLTGTNENDSLAGTWASEQLDGGAGADTPTGGGGDDLYLVDNINDVVVEYARNQ